MKYIKKLKKVSTYAKEQNISAQAVYKQIAFGKIECVIIDGVKFIRVKENGN